MQNKFGVPHIYHVKKHLRWIMLGMASLVAGMHMLMVRNLGFNNLETPLIFLMFILLFDAFMLWYTLIFTMQTRVKVSEDGLEFQQGGASWFTTWDNISHFGIRSFSRSQHIGIHLYHEIQPDVTGLADRLFLGRKKKFISLQHLVDFPCHFGIFRRPIDFEKFAETEFGRDVAYYAPHLVEAPEQEKPKINRLVDKSSKATFVVGSDVQTLRKNRHR